MVTETAALPVDKDAETQEFAGDVRVSQNPPSKKDWARVADIPVFNAKHEAVPFGSLHADPAQRTLVCFIRHFFCGNCQEYLRTLCASITPDVLAGLATPTRVVIIGCGQPDLIDFYAQTTGCPYPIYAEPTKKIYAALGMIRTLDLGPGQPEYMHKSVASVVISSFSQVVSSGSKAFKGGDFRQVGGEFLLHGTETLFCHRMRNTRDHTEMPELRRLLELPAETTPARPKERGGLMARAGSLRQSSRSRSRAKEPAETPLDPVGENKENASVPA